jgi:hypothetical protein
MTGSSIPEVAVAGWSWTTVGVGLLNLLVGGALVAWIKSRPQMRKLEKEAEEKLIDTLSARVDKLEAEIRNQRDHYEQKIDRLQATYEADKRISRHELGNVKMRFRALVMLLKRLPDPPPMLAAILADIENMEAEQARAEALEKGAQAGARIDASGGAT